VRYIPGKRCVFRYESATSGAHRAVYAKVYEDPLPAGEAHALLVALWHAAAADAALLRVPEPLHFDPEGWTTYQGALPGTSFVAAARSVTPAQVAAIGRGLARLHVQRLPVRETWRLGDELARAVARADEIAAVHPPFAVAIAAVVGALAARLPHLPRLPLVPSHGTFKLAHLVQDGDRIGLVDFDSFVQADPLYDVANFTADLHYLEAAGVLPPGRAVRLGDVVHEAWSASVPWGRRDAVLDWYVASLLVRKQAMKCVKHLHPDARVKIRRLLAAASERLREDAP
jgi:hypothetical protein